MARCTLCYKSVTAGSKVSHSQIHTKRKFAPNLQKVNGLLLCTRCLKTINKQKRVQAERVKEQSEIKAKSTEIVEASVAPDKEEKSAPKNGKKSAGKKVVKNESKSEKK